MADEHEDITPEPEPDAERQLAGAAAMSALNKERKENKDLKARIRALEEAEQRRADSELAEVERERKARERVEAELAETRAAIESDRLERDRVDRVRRAAGEFEDPEIVIALLKGQGRLEEIDSDADATRILKALAKDTPKLLRATESPATGLEQVLKNGRPTENADQERFAPQDIIPGEQLIAMSNTDLAALKRTNPQLYFKSVDALGRSERDFAVSR